MKRRLVLLFGIVMVFGFSTLVEAKLWDRGDGLIYDDVLDVTWLQDANYPLTIGAGGWDGRMKWNDAMSFVSQLDFAGFDDWRLPKTLPIDGSDYDYTYLYDGSADRGFNISAPGSIYEGSTSSELAYMYYNNLQNLGQYDMNGDEQEGWGLKNTDPFQNIMPSCNYWSSTDYAPNPSYYAWAFDFGDGDQNHAIKGTINSYVWPVRDGDVTEPCTVDICPDTLNLKSKGTYITCYIEVPEEYDVNGIDIGTVELIIQSTPISAESSSIEVGDYNNNSVLDLMVKFDRQIVQDLCVEEAAKMVIYFKDLQGNRFKGEDTVLVIDKGKDHFSTEADSVVY